MSLNCSGPHKCGNTIGATYRLLDAEKVANKVAQAELAALRAQRDELAEALRAFTDFPADLLQCFLDDPTGAFTFTVPVGHMAAAVTALAKLEVKP